MNQPAPPTVGTDLYRRVTAYAEERGADDLALHLKVWQPTPWMIDVYVGKTYSEEWLLPAHHEWCNANLGEESWPIHGHPGVWHRGGATVDGWTWYGFATEDLMRRFLAQFPQPPMPGETTEPAKANP